MTIQELKQKRETLVKQNQKEYRTRVNTQRCQELWCEIEKIDALIEKMKENQ